MAKPQSIGFNYELLERQNNTIAQGALTNSKRPECFIKGVFPTHLSRASGVHIWDTKGNRFIDFTSALGTNVVGYANEEVNNAIIEAIRKGTSLPLATELEVETAEKIKEIFPFVERLRFLKTGSEACSVAIRIARAKTRRNIVVSEGYHGWHDEFVSLTPPSFGVPTRGSICSIKDNDEPNTRDAAFIIEPVMTDMSEERIKWLRDLRKKCTDTGTILIFDEIITGFRTPAFSISNHLGIDPDLICLGKAMANGMPLAVVGGRKEIMECEDEYFVSSTFAGERASLAAALKTMQLLQTKRYDMDLLWAKGAEFQFRFNSIWPECLRIQGYPTRGVFEGPRNVCDLFRQEALKAGYFFGSSFFFTFGHMEYTDTVISNCKDILQRIKTGSVNLEGESSKTPFAQQQRSK